MLLMIFRCLLYKQPLTEFTFKKTLGKREIINFVYFLIQNGMQNDEPVIHRVKQTNARNTTFIKLLNPQNYYRVVLCVI